MLSLVLASSIACGEVVPASTWATAGLDCELFAVADVDGDGFGDVVTQRGVNELLVARSVRGWKASVWQPLDAASFPGGSAGFDREAKLVLDTQITPAAPPYEPEAKLVRVFGGDLDGDGDADTLALYRCTRPHDFYELRVAFTLGPNTDDLDGDGLSEADELHWKTDPRGRDSDHDGLLDGWEVHGLPRGIKIEAGSVLSPARQDVIVAITRYDPLDRTRVRSELERGAQLFRALPNENLDGSTGVFLHLRIDGGLPVSEQRDSDWYRVGNLRLAPRERGLLHWMQISHGGGGQSQQTGDMGGCGPGFAVFAHEFGHQLSLSHEGDTNPAWCPLYPSLMNYAFTYALGGDEHAVQFSRGELRETVLDESALVERLPYPLNRVRYLEAPPFRFTLEPDGDSATRIDWNHDGRFDDAPVSADINYGSSTNCGTRRDLDGLKIGAAPALAYVGEHCYLVTVDQAESAIALRRYLGNEQWSEPQTQECTATSDDPLMIGWRDRGWIFLRRATGWMVSAFDDLQPNLPAEVAGLRALDLGGACVGERVLLITRASDDSLAAQWLDSPERLEVTPAQQLQLQSQVPVGVAVDPSDGRVVVASSATNGRGIAMCLRVSWFRVEGDALVEEETRWVRGEASGTNSTTRPVIAFDTAGQLNLFHTGAQQSDGSMTAWRTRRIANAALDEGWLTCLLYDIWTRTRRAIAFASGPQGALYAFRWDAAELHGMQLNQLLVAHNGFGIDREPMRDFDDGAKISKYGLVHSILYMRAEDE